MTEVPLSKLIDIIRHRYTAEIVPPCNICGRQLSIQRAGGGASTVWACAGFETDPENPDRLRKIEGRDYADDHYEKSRFIQYRGGDESVLTIVDALSKSLELLKKTQGVLHPSDPNLYGGMSVDNLRKHVQLIATVGAEIDDFLNKT